MDVKVLTIINSIELLNKISKNSLSIPTAVALRKILVELDPISKEFFSKRDTLLKDNSEEVEDNKGEKVRKLREDAIEEVNKEITKMLEQVVDLEFKPLAVSSLEKDNVKLSVEDIGTIEYLLNLEG